ncbi:hypothetical protein LVJ94_39290 [Pendulispora rubella]|uniref:Zinc-finger domain-containing protein n=1 Tax=Pendulispora rubella TaxID=2741070 RepID=A0ABZ2L138_9BACT
MVTRRCLSDYRIDAFLAGELRDEETERHFAECEKCRARRDELSAEYARMREQWPPLRLPTKRATRRWPAMAVGGLALAAGIALFVRTRHEDTTRLKGGGNEVAFFVEHEDHVRSGVPGERVQPGDKLQFAYSARHPVHVLVLSVDGSGAASVYADGAAEMPATTGNEVRALPTSIVLDDVLGEESIVGLVCDGPEDAEPLRARLLREGDRFTAPPSCTATRWTLVKGARTP